MTAARPQRRTMTAKEAAARYGVSERTIRRIAAEPRSEFLARAARNREEAMRLRAEGLPYTVIAERMGVPLGTAKRLVHDARKKAAPQT